MRRGDIATRQIITYVYFSGVYHPEKCFEEIYNINMKPKIKKVNCNALDP